MLMVSLPFSCCATDVAHMTIVHCGLSCVDRLCGESTVDNDHLLQSVRPAPPLGYRKPSNC